tara:strand:- start:1683 stop:2465 length:783 start_codon:yes stop_codon:yes gene_type:complete
MLANKYHPATLMKKLKDAGETVRSLTQALESSATETYHFAKAETQTLTTSTVDVETFDFPATTNNKDKNRIVDVTFFYTKAYGGAVTSSTVDSVEVKTPTDFTAIELGVATHVSNPALYSQIVKIQGNVISKVGAIGAVSTNVTGTGSYAIRAIGTAYYNINDDHTYLRINGYPSNLVVDGTPATIYYSPFSFVAAGTWVIDETTHSDTITYGTNYTERRFYLNLGCLSEALELRVRSKKSTSSHSISVTDLRGSLTSSI